MNNETRAKLKSMLTGEDDSEVTQAFHNLRESMRKESEERAARPKKIKLPSPIAFQIRCQEAHTLSKEFYIPCGQEAVALIENKDSYLYFMCEGCTSHNVKNRGGKIVAELESGVFGE